MLQSRSSSVIESSLIKDEVASLNLGLRLGYHGGVAKRLRQGSAKSLCSGSNPLAASLTQVEYK